MDQIIYQIAEEFIVLHTLDARAVERSLAKYAPFVRTDVSSSSSPILEVWEDKPCTLEAADELIEEVDDLAYYSRVYRHSEHGRLTIEISHQGIAMRGQIDSQWQTLYLSTSLGSYPHRFLIDRLIMIAFSMRTSREGCLKVHASVIEHSGRALVFLGVSGTGKSTHTRLWREYIQGATLLNDDEPIVRLMPSGQVRVYGCPWSGSTPCYRDTWAEVAGFVMLRQAPINELTRLSAREAFDALFTSCAVMHSCRETKARIFHCVADVLGTVPVYRLDNRPELAAVQLSHSILYPNS